MRTVQIPTDQYRLRFAAFCGMSYDIAEDMDHDQARDRLAAYLRRMRADGRQINYFGPERYEIEEPADCAMVPDDAGIVWIAQQTVPGVECWACGYPVKLGEACDCQDDPAGLEDGSDDWTEDTL